MKTYRAMVHERLATVESLLNELSGGERIVHVAHLPQRDASYVPLDLTPDIATLFGHPRLWSHQAEAIKHIRLAGR